MNGGPNGLLASLDDVTSDGELTVTFNLNKPDATFPFVLAAPAMSIVDPAEYPADKLREDGKLTGSGPYTLESYTVGSNAELAQNASYKGFADRKNKAVTIQYFQDSDKLFGALKKKEIDVIYRGLTSEEVVELEQKKEENDHLQLVETVGADIRYLVFNPKDEWAAKLPVRQAVAQVVDRDALVAKVYQGTAEPLYSMVPKGISGHATSFFDEYGDPDVGKARTILQDAGIETPVPLTFWFTTDRYGSGTVAEFAELKRQLEASGLFKITLKSKPWKDFQAGFQKGEYPVFGRGWFPDFPTPTTSWLPSSARTTPSARHTRAPRSPPSCCRSRGARATGARSSSSSSAPRRSSSTMCGCCRCGRASSTSRPRRRSAAASGRSTRRRSCSCGSSAARPAGSRGSRDCQWSPVGSAVDQLIAYRRLLT